MSACSPPSFFTLSLSGCCSSATSSSVLPNSIVFDSKSFLFSAPLLKKPVVRLAAIPPNGPNASLIIPSRPPVIVLPMSLKFFFKSPARDMSCFKRESLAFAAFNWFFAAFLASSLPALAPANATLF